MKKITYIVVLLITLLSLCNLQRNFPSNIKIGIVDTDISKEYTEKNNIDKIMKNNICNYNTHGDMTVDFIKRENKKSIIYVANVIGSNGICSIDEVINGLDWLIENNVEVICMSFTTLENNSKLQEKINEILGKNIIIVASCLNYSVEETYPASYSGVISVSNVYNPNAIICITDKKIKNKFNISKWKQSSTSIFTAYVTGDISKKMLKKGFSINDYISNFN